jgi:hypothetical protein
LPPFRVPDLNYVPPHPSTPMDAHHGHTWTSLTHSPVHTMLFCILACFAMWCMVVLHECLVCLLACFGVYSLSTCPNHNPEYIRLCCCPFPAFS